MANKWKAGVYEKHNELCSSRPRESDVRLDVAPSVIVLLVHSKGKSAEVD